LTAAASGEPVTVSLGLLDAHLVGEGSRQRCAAVWFAFFTTPFAVAGMGGGQIFDHDAVVLRNPEKVAVTRATAGLADRGHPVEPPLLAG
jgi:hypothetical protein